MSGFRRYAPTALCAGALLLASAACTSKTAGTGAFAQPPCSGNTIKPSGAPYCYVVPDGFSKLQRAELGGVQYAAGVGLDNNNIIVTGSLHNDHDVNSDDSKKLVDATDKYVASFRDLTFDSTHGTLTTTAGGRTVSYQAKVTQDGKQIAIGLYFVYSGNTVLQVNCQSTDQQAKIGQGCQDVLNTVHLSSSS